MKINIGQKKYKKDEKTQVGRKTENVVFSSFSQRYFSNEIDLESRIIANREHNSNLSSWKKKAREFS